MEKGNMRVTEIMALYQQAQRGKRIPTKARKQRKADEFEIIFKEKCEEIKPEGDYES